MNAWVVFLFIFIIAVIIIAILLFIYKPWISNPVPLQGSCNNTNLLCFQGLVCAAGLCKIANGGPCQNSTDCASAKCVSQVCTA